MLGRDSPALHEQPAGSASRAMQIAEWSEMAFPEWNPCHLPPSQPGWTLPVRWAWDFRFQGTDRVHRLHYAKCVPSAGLLSAHMAEFKTRSNWPSQPEPAPDSWRWAQGLERSPGTSPSRQLGGKVAAAVRFGSLDRIHRTGITRVLRELLEFGRAVLERVDALSATQFVPFLTTPTGGGPGPRQAGSVVAALQGVRQPSQSAIASLQESYVV